jgi:hypothetical protein
MKRYIVTTGAIFALLAFAHVLRTIAEWPRLGSDPWFLLQGPGIGILAAGVAAWAWRLVRLPAQAR